MSTEPNHFSTAQRAFPACATAHRYFASEAAEAARGRLELCLERGDGPALLIGASGCGKTMIVEVLAEQFAERLRVVKLASTQLCTRRALLQAILYGLGRPYREQDEGELRFALVEALVEQAETLPPVALLVDEAQTLPLRLLEELRLLSNQTVGGEPRLLLVLAGTGSLDEMFTATELEPFSQRLAARCYLSPLTREETNHYVRAHIAAAGEDPDRLIDETAYRAIFQASDGVPRLINQVCDRALLWCLQEQVSVVDSRAIQEAWSDLHQLPAPWHTPEVAAPTASDSSLYDHEEASPTPTAGAIEFGQLDGSFDLVDETPLENAIEGGCSSGSGCSGGGCCKTDAAVCDSVWNADEALAHSHAVSEVISQERELEIKPLEDEAECIAYAFPSTDELVPTDAPDLPEQNHDPEPAEEHHDTPDTTVNDPFEEPFDEEEVVLDRYAGLESVLPAGAPEVINGQELDFGRMFQALSPAVESLLDDVAQRIEAPVAPADFGVVIDAVSPEAAPTEASSEIIVEEVCSTPEEELLIVEETETPAEVSPAHRQEYRQLFATLREG